ncbi:MAG: hypothetical protein AAB425_11000, partial [Bdellovibrionota bacterium]
MLNAVLVRNFASKFLEPAGRGVLWRSHVGTLLIAGLAMSLSGCLKTGLEEEPAVIEPGVQPVAVGPAAVGKLALSGPMTLTSGKCSAFYTVSTLDAAGNSTLSETELSLSLKADGPGSFYGDAGCTARPITVAKVPAGDNYSVFRFRASKPGKDTITASATGITAASIVTEVSAANTAIIGLSGPSAASAGACAGPYT